MSPEAIYIARRRLSPHCRARAHVQGQALGFTLIEVMVVLVLMALVTGTAALSMGRKVGRASHEQCVSALQAIDTRARHQARVSGREVRVVIDTERGVLELAAKTEGRQTILDAYTLPTSMEIKRAWLLHENRQLNRNLLTILYDTEGTCPTFGLALVLQDARGDTTTKSLLMAGGSGQLLVFDDEDEVHNLLSQITRHDTD